MNIVYNGMSIPLDCEEEIESALIELVCPDTKQIKKLNYVYVLEIGISIEENPPPPPRLQ